MQSKLLTEYFQNVYFKNIIPILLIFLFSIVFYLIYQIIDLILDKEKHYNLALEIAGNYQASKTGKKNGKIEYNKDSDQNKENHELDQRKQDDQIKKIQFSVWSYRNLQISFIHSVLCSLWLIRILLFRHQELFADLLFFVTWDSYLIITFSCGYFLYDFFDIYKNGYMKIEWVVCAHHVIVLLSFGYHLTHLLSVGYTVCALFMEFNSVFLHARKLLKFYGYSYNDLLVQVNKILNILSFIFFRFGVLILIYVALYKDGDRVTIQYVIFLFTCVFLMSIINVVLFKRLLLKDFFNNIRQKQKLNEKNTKNDESEMKLLNVNKRMKDAYSNHDDYNTD